MPELFQKKSFISSAPIRIFVVKKRRVSKIHVREERGWEEEGEREGRGGREKKSGREKVERERGREDEGGR